MLDELAQLYKLDNVSGSHQIVLAEESVVAVKLLHRLEVLVADPHDDDGQGQDGGGDDCLLCLREISYDSISDYQEDEIIRRIVLIDMSKL